MLSYFIYVCHDIAQNIFNILNYVFSSWVNLSSLADVVTMSVDSFNSQKLSFDTSSQVINILIKLRIMVQCQFYILWILFTHRFFFLLFFWCLR